jgi:hypothetical protein
MTKPVRYVLDKPKRYYILAIPADKPASEPREWIQILSGVEPVDDPELEEYDFFTHYNGPTISISCAITGAGRGGYFSRAEAIAALKKGLEAIGGPKEYQKFIAKALSAEPGLSPRYRKEGGNRRKPLPPPLAQRGEEKRREE